MNAFIDIRYLLVAIAKTTEFFLTSCVPYVELDCAQVGKELQRIYLHSQSSYQIIIIF